MFANIIYFLLFTSALGVHKFYTHTDTNSFGDFSLGAGFDINRFEPKNSHVFRESKNDLFYDIMPITSTKSRCSLIARQKDISDKLKVFGSMSVSYNMISGSGQITFDQKKETMNRVAYYSCTVDRTLFTISVNAPEITGDWLNIQGDYIPDNLFQLDGDELHEEVGDYHIRSITYGRRYNTEIRMEYSSEDAFELISGKLKADIGIGALKVAAEVEVDKETDTFEEDLTLTISSEALGFIEPESVFMPSNSLKIKNADGTWSGAEVSVTEQVEQMIKSNLEAFNKLDALTIEPQTGLSKKELFNQIGSAYPLWYTVERNFPYFKEQLTKLSAFEEERMLKNLNQAYSILRELEDMTQDVESRAELLFENYHLLSGATELSKEFLKYRQDLLTEILGLQSEVLEYLEQRPILLAKENIYMWASNSEHELHYISIDVLHTKVWDLLGMQDVPMEDENEIGSTCLFNGVQAILEGENNRRKFAGRVVFGDVTVRHVVFDINGKVVSLGYIDHEYDNRKNQAWEGAPHELVFVREDCTLLRAEDAVWYQGARYTIASIGSEEYMTPRGYVNKEKLTNIRLHLAPQDTTRDIEVVLTGKEVADVESRGYETSSGLTLDATKRLMYQNGYVCDKGFTANEANMICTHLGYANLDDFQTGFAIPPSNAWGRPHITMVSLDCPQYAFTLDKCDYKTNKMDDSLWDFCGINNGVQLSCSNTITDLKETAKMKVSSETHACVRDINALSQKVDTAESCSGGKDDDASNFGIVQEVVVNGDICVKLYRDDKLQCVVSESDVAWDFTNNEILAKFCYDDAFNSPDPGLAFPDEIEMMPASKYCRDQDDLVKDMQYQYDGNTLTVVSCEAGKNQGFCDESSMLEEKDLITFQKACKRSCTGCQPNLRTYYQVTVIATEDSFAWKGDDKIPVTVSLKSGSEKEDEEFRFAHADEHVFNDDIPCGSQRQISIKPDEVYDHGSVICAMKSMLGEREVRIDSEGRVIMAGDLVVTFECFNPPSFAPTRTPSYSPTTPMPSLAPASVSPTVMPSPVPTDFPTTMPSPVPTDSPTTMPSPAPTPTVWANENCYVDETFTSIVNSQCIADSPSITNAGTWYRMPADWTNNPCDDSTCVYRCRENGAAFNSDLGPEYGDGDTVDCYRKRH